jgi:hypothetical protein
MGVRILIDKDAGQACLYCSTSDFAFGPVFSDKAGRSADERAEAFLRWINAHPISNPTSRLFGQFDVRHLEDKDLERAYLTWLVQEEAQFQIEEAA